MVYGFLCAVAQRLDTIYDCGQIWASHAEAWPVVFDTLPHS